MKSLNVNQYSYLLFLVITILACQTDKSLTQLPDASVWKAPVFSTPTIEDRNVFLESKKDDTFKTFAWKHAELGQNIVPTYALDISTENDFPEAKTLELTTANTNSVKVSFSAMNEKLISLLIKIDANYVYQAVPTTVYFRVTAFIDAQNKIKKQYGTKISEPIHFIIVPYQQLPPAVNKCTTAPLNIENSFIGLIGDAVNGWGDNDDHKMGSLSDALPCSFITKVTLKPGGFKFRANGKWDVPGNWGDVPFPDGGTANDDGGSGNSTVTAENEGTYTVTFNLETLAVTFLKEGDTVDTTINEPDQWTMPVFTNLTATPAVFTVENLNATPTPIYEAFSWSVVVSGSTTTPAKYTLEIGDMMNFDATNAKKLFFGEPQLELTKSINKKEINKIILDNLGGVSGTGKSIYFRLRIQVGTKSGFSTPITRTITPILLCPTNITSVGIIGTSANGWDKDVNLIKDATNEYIYRITIQLKAGEFKLRANDAWDINWNASKLTSPPTGFTGTDNITVASSAVGYYTIELDTCTGNFTVVAKTCPTNITSVGIIGTGSVADGWDADVNLTVDATNSNIYKITTTLKAGEFKLRANDTWDINWNASKLTSPPTGFTGTDNITVASTAAGTYNIELDVCAGTFTVTSN